MTLVNDVHSRLNETAVEGIVPVGSLESIGAALVRARDACLPVSIAEDPLVSVVLGTGKMLTEFKLLRRIAIE